ncbi:hypothetical protein HC031_29015 [Planosporangium thailandense]|uniref:Uncharacterized protein n=1 Tax=Planosporangium thailandense TaxID=765197 RepID=A0ABX0Y8X8_9ACTN|nr:hypothetical protein [Planosporangium thailandense]NJC73729.1 hypothetical protein [Planosporangium thailandense]
MSTSVEQAHSEIVVADDEVEGSRPGACWSVRECGWRNELPEDVVELLAPPVIVSAEAFAPAGACDVVAAEEPEPVAYRPRHAAPEEALPAFTAPPRRLRRRRPAAA